jgi:hypothetical protein
MLLNKAYYTFKFLVPRPLQIRLRRYFVRRKRSSYADIWPIDPNAAKPDSSQFPNWPDGKKFALVLTHDVETATDPDKCHQLAELKECLSFRSSYNFVAGDYPVPAALRQRLTDGDRLMISVRCKGSLALVSIWYTAPKKISRLADRKEILRRIVQDSVKGQGSGKAMWN